jgi:RNA polymerase sigma-70 factor (ECF subfamily)
MQAVVNESRTVLRRGSRTTTLVDRAVVDAAPQSEVLEAVMQLPHRQRAATYLVFWVGMNSREAGVLLGCRAATVRRYLLLAKRRLKGVLSDDD